MSRSRQLIHHCSGCPLIYCSGNCSHSYAPHDPPRQSGRPLLIGLLILIALLVLVVAFSRPAFPQVMSQTIIPTSTGLSGITMLQSTIVPPTPTPAISGDAWEINQRGLKALAQGDQAQAAALFQAAIDADPSYYEPANNLAFMRYEQGQDVVAIQLWDQALARSPLSPDANAGMGMALAAQGRIDEAWVYYSRALYYEPGYADAAWMQQERLWGPRALAHAAPLRDRAGAAR